MCFPRYKALLEANHDYRLPPPLRSGAGQDSLRLHPRSGCSLLILPPGILMAAFRWKRCRTMVPLLD